MIKNFILTVIMLFCSELLYIQGQKYVSPSGNDANAGTIDAPFKTISRGLNGLKSGSILYVRKGVYHETVKFNSKRGSTESPIVIKNYQDEKVIIDGSQPIEELATSDWILHKDDIYKIHLKEDITQVFVDRVWMMAARWPNARFDKGEGWDKKTWAQGNEKLSGNTVLFDDPQNGHDLAKSGLDVKGAMAVMNIGKFVSCCRRVESHNAGQNFFEFKSFPRYLPKENYYFLEGKLEFLDNETEWYFDNFDKVLYLWVPGGGKPQANVRAKTMRRGMDFFKSNHIKVQGIDFFACNFGILNCNSIILEDCDFDYPTYNRRALGVTGEERAIEIRNGSNSKIINCAFRNTDGMGLRTLASNNITVENCEFTNIDYTVAHQPMGGGAVVFRRGSNCTFRRNTVTTSGSARGIGFDNKSVLELNYIRDLGHLQSDGSSAEFGGGAKDMLFSHNWFDSNRKSSARFSDGSRSVLPKSGMRTGILRNNVTTNPAQSITFMVKGDEREVYNNVAETNIVFADTSKDPKTSGIHRNSISANNATARYVSRVFPSFINPSGKHMTNWESKGDKEAFKLLFYDWDNKDFRPRPNSGLVDKGSVVMGINNEFRGKGPDIGAYELGDKDYWIPGRQLEKTSHPIPANGGKTIYERVDLIWLHAYKSGEAEIYFGDSASTLKSLGRFKNNIVNPGKLVANTTYYWRADAIVNGKVKQGEVWHFTAGVNTLGESIDSAQDISDHLWDKSSFKVYPNPTSGNMSIEIPEYDIRVSVYSVSGQLVLSKQVKKQFSQLETNALAKGIYIVRFEKEGHFIDKKIVKL
ncbi:MAG: T9SS type A sorting domain-containing protein [Carboxylicivirga sp.]|jgi:hypothetical protein|nr:T9SS type A sorting domain-containing protein [Carboxylicivirga sp.]